MATRRMRSFPTLPPAAPNSSKPGLQNNGSGSSCHRNRAPGVESELVIEPKQRFEEFLLLFSLLSRRSWAAAADRLPARQWQPADSRESCAAAAPQLVMRASNKWGESGSWFLTGTETTSTQVGDVCPQSWPTFIPLETPVKKKSPCDTIFQLLHL